MKRGGPGGGIGERPRHGERHVVDPAAGEVLHRQPHDRRTVHGDLNIMFPIACQGQPHDGQRGAGGNLADEPRRSRWLPPAVVARPVGQSTGPAPSLPGKLDHASDHAAGHGAAAVVCKFDRAATVHRWMLSCCSRLTA